MALNVKAPSLPIPTLDYEKAQQEQFQYALRVYFNRLETAIVALSTPEFGATADRPTTQLQIGQFYFDTTLGYPIWYDGTDWVNSSGTVV